MVCITEGGGPAPNAAMGSRRRLPPPPPPPQQYSGGPPSGLPTPPRHSVLRVGVWVGKWVYFGGGRAGPQPRPWFPGGPPPPPPKHLDIFKGAPLRLPKPRSDQFSVRVLVPPLYVNRQWDV